MILSNKAFIQFLVTFILVFLFCYYGALAITGLAAPGGLYSSFVNKYLNVADWLRDSLIFGTQNIVSLFSIETKRVSDYELRIPFANGIKIVYSCLGFGVMSFWTAYIIATKALTTKKFTWLFVGLLLLWIINVLRISMVLLAGNKGWKFPFGWDHHTWFNIIAYLFIFTMMYFFERNIKMKLNAG